MHSPCLCNFPSFHPAPLPPPSSPAPSSSFPSPAPPAPGELAANAQGRDASFMTKRPGRFIKNLPPNSKQGQFIAQPSRQYKVRIEQDLTFSQARRKKRCKRELLSLWVATSTDVPILWTLRLLSSADRLLPFPNSSKGQIAITQPPDLISFSPQAHIKMNKRSIGLVNNLLPPPTHGSIQYCGIIDNQETQ